MFSRDTGVSLLGERESTLCRVEFRSSSSDFSSSFSWKMRFRVRDYRAEALASELPRTLADDDHPLRLVPPPQEQTRKGGRRDATTPSSTHSISSSTFHQASHRTETEETTLFDPLRYPLEDALVLSDENETTYTSKQNLDECNQAGEVSKREWLAFRRSLMQKSSISKIPVRSTSVVIHTSSKGKSLTAMHLEEIEDPKEVSEGEVEFITTQQYVARLNELKQDITKAWIADDRVTALKLSIKVTRLLMDTSVPSFYPTLFMLVTDVLDMLGSLVWERIKRKAEYNDDGQFLTSLPECFGAKHVRLEAKDTCRNWFAKIGTIRELLPRVYLELSIMHCWVFLDDNIVNTVERLTMMIRGVTDPLASAYCRAYMVRNAQELLPHDSGYLITLVDDSCTLMRPIIIEKENISGTFEKRKLVALLEPTIDWITKCLFRSTSQSEKKLLVIFEKLGLRKSESCSCVSIVLHYLLRNVPSETFSLIASDMVDLIRGCNDISLDQSLNYRLLGSKLCECSHSLQSSDLILRKVFKVVSHYDDFCDYLKVAEIFLDFIIQDQMESHLNIILEEIQMRAGHGKVTEEELPCIESIMIKVVNHFHSLRELLGSNHFMSILDATYGGTRRTICSNVLANIVRNGCIQEPMEIRFLFEIAQTLYDKLEGFTIGDNQYDGLICRFIEQVDFGSDTEGYLNFLVDCRASFGRTDQLLCTVIRSSNCLAVKVTKAGGNDSDNFLKACVAFAEVTILAIMDNIKRINLSLETAEIALQHGLLSHTEDLVGVAINSFESIDQKNGSSLNFDTENLALSIQNFCSFLIMIPDYTEHGICSVLRRLFNFIDSVAWMTPRLICRLLCAIISVAATVSQRGLPYHVTSDVVLSNDLLYVGDQCLIDDLNGLCTSIVPCILNSLQKETNPVVKAFSALEACDYLLSAFQVTDVSDVCFQLLDIAKISLPENHSYLQSVVNVLNKSLVSAGFHSDCVS